MKKQKSLSKAKRLAILASIGSIAGMFDNIKMNASFALSSEKCTAKKSDMTISQSIVKNFFDEVPKLEIMANGTTIFGFCDKMCDRLIKNTHGTDKIRVYQAISDAVAKEYEVVKDANERDDSMKLIQAF